MSSMVYFVLFVSFMEKTPPTIKCYGVFDHFSPNFEVTKFWKITLYIDVSDVIYANEQTNYANCGLHITFEIFWPGRFPRIAGNHGNDRKFHKSHQILAKPKETINYGWENFPSKSSKNKIFGGFRIFEYAIWQKTKTWKCRKSTESFLNIKSPTANGYQY